MARTRANRQEDTRRAEQSKPSTTQKGTSPESPNGAPDKTSRDQRKRKLPPSAPHSDDGTSPPEEPKRSRIEHRPDEANIKRAESPAPLRYSPEQEEEPTPPQAAVSADSANGSTNPSDAAATLRKQLGLMTPRTVRLTRGLPSTKTKQATESVRQEVREEKPEDLVPRAVAPTHREPSSDRHDQPAIPDEASVGNCAHADAPTTTPNTTLTNSEATSANDPRDTKHPRPRIVFDSSHPSKDNVSQQAAAASPAGSDSKAAQATPDRNSQTSSPSSDSPAQRRRPRIAMDSSFNSNKSERFSPYSTPPHSQKNRFSGGLKSSPLSISRGVGGKGFKRAPTMFTIDNKAITPFFTKAYCFSNHFECDRLEIDGVNFVCTEQYYMYWKAKLFGDSRSASAILGATNPKAMKKIGSGIANFDQHRWNNVSVQVMAIANYRKYEQNPALRQELFRTTDTLLVEASPMDQRWGIGVGLDDVDRLRDQSQWRGLNILGRLLSKIRDRLLKRPEFADEAQDVLQQNG